MEQFKKKSVKLTIAFLIFLAIVWIYPVHMKNIVLWMNTTEDTEAYVVTRLMWDDGTGYATERISENAIVSQEVFVRIPRAAKKNAVQYRLIFQNEDKDITISEITLNAASILPEQFLKCVDSTENMELNLENGVIKLRVSGENPVITFNDEFTRLVKRSWHMANNTRLWLTLFGTIGFVWGLIYVKMEDE